MSANVNDDRPPSETVYLELSEGQSHKFYEVTVHETEVTICYGRIGTAGQSSSTTYATVEKAQAAARKKINEKLGKGYVQVVSRGEELTVVEQPPPASGPVSTVGEVRSHRFDLARLRLGIYQDGIFLGVPLQEVLVAVEITAICNQPTFVINLDAGSNIAYHFNARSSERRIVQNTCVAGVWGTGGEILSIPPELISSEPFTLKIAVEQELVVYLNDRVLTRYSHCLPPTQINAIHIVYPPDNLQVQSVQVFEQTVASTEMAAGPRGQQPSQSQPAESPSTASEAIAQTPATSTDPTLSPLLRDLLPQFEPLRPFLESNLQPYIKIHVGEALEWLEFDWNGDPLEPWQSKIGGHPYLPKETDYPTDRETGEMMMFLMQVNCADLPIIDGLALPRQGILQFYSGLNPPMCELSPEQHRILYFPKISQDRSNLMTDFSFLLEFARYQEWYTSIYPLTFSAQQDVFCTEREGYRKTFDAPKELETLWEEFHDWLSDHDQETFDRRQDKLGGEVEFHSYVDETVGEAKGELLLELSHPDGDGDFFYFFIEASDLANLDFGKVKSYFMRV